MPWAKARQSYQPFNLGAEVGTTGYGGTAGWRIANHFGVMGGMDYLSYTLNRTINDVPYSAHLRLQSEYAALNLYPWRNSSFRLSLGQVLESARRFDDYVAEMGQAQLMAPDNADIAATLASALHLAGQADALKPGAC